MEHPVSSQADGTSEAEEVEPWNLPGRYWVLGSIVSYLQWELNDNAPQLMWQLTREQWRALLLDAYREMVALGLLTP